MWDGESEQVAEAGEFRRAAERRRDGGSGAPRRADGDSPGSQDRRRSADRQLPHQHRWFHHHLYTSCVLRRVSPLKPATHKNIQL